MTTPTPEMFFVEAGMPDLRRVAKRFPGVRQLYDRKSPLRFKPVLEILAVVAGAEHKRKAAATSWAEAEVKYTAGPAINFAMSILGYEGMPVDKDTILPTKGIGFMICPGSITYTATILLDDMRILRWCQDMAVPTFGIKRPLSDAVLIHKEI